MTDYTYSKVAVYAELGGALRLARNSRSFATDPVTAAPINVTQGAFTAAYFDTDSSGIADFTATTPGPIRLTTGATFVDVYSEQLPGDLLAAEANAAASAASAALSASLVGAPADTAVAALVGTPASATATALSSTYALASMSAVGNRCVFLGDSTVIGADSGTGVGQNWGDSWPSYAALNSGGKIFRVFNAGVSGNTSAQILARFATDVTPYTPNVVFIGGFVNDPGNSVTLATSAANMRSIVADCRAIQALPVICNLPPNGTGAPTNRVRDINRLNAWLSRYAAAQGLPLVDFYSLLTDTTTGNYLAAYDSGDHTHPSAAGYAAMGALAASTMTMMRPWAPPLPAWNSDPENNPNNALMLVDVGADGVPDQWTASGGSSGFTHSIVTDALVIGKMAKIAQAANASVRQLYSGAVKGTYTGADVVGFGGIVTGDGGVAAQLKIQFFTAGSVSISSQVYVFTQAVTRGTFWVETACPATTAIIAVSLIAGLGTGNVQWGRIAVKNLTGEGIVAA